MIVNPSFLLSNPSMAHAVGEEAVFLTKNFVKWLLIVVVRVNAPPFFMLRDLDNNI